MKKIRYYILFVWALLFAGCGNIGEEGKSASEGDAAVLEGIDSSARMNDSTLLPLDSANTGVTH